VAFVSFATPSLRAEEIVLKGRLECKEAFWWLLRLAEDLLRVSATRRAFKVVLNAPSAGEGLPLASTGSGYIDLGVCRPYRKGPVWT
jgi:hypothetical protein